MTATLTISRRFIEDFMGQDAPCFALAMLEERGRLFAALVLNPGVALPDGVSADGFEFGHSVLGGADYEILHFAFEFRGFATYNVFDELLVLAWELQGGTIDAITRMGAAELALAVLTGRIKPPR